MALDIRDLRKRDTSELARLRAAALVFGRPPAQDGAEEGATHMLVGLRNNRLAGAIWLGLDGARGSLPAVVVEQSVSWQSDVRELVAEAGLWLTSRGAAWIELKFVPEDKDLLCDLLDMHFRPVPSMGTLKQLVPARSAT